MKTWWGIRHIRYRLAVIHYNIWWDAVGRHLGIVPSQHDEDYLDGIRDGKW